MANENKYGMERIIVILLAWFFGALGLHLVYMRRITEFKRHWLLLVASLLAMIPCIAAWTFYYAQEGDTYRTYGFGMMSCAFIGVNLNVCVFNPFRHIWRTAVYDDNDFSSLIGQHPSHKIPEKGCFDDVPGFVIFIAIAFGIFVAPTYIQEAMNHRKETIEVQAEVDVFLQKKKAEEEAEKRRIEKENEWKRMEEEKVERDRMIRDRYIQKVIDERKAKEEQQKADTEVVRLTKEKAEEEAEKRRIEKENEWKRMEEEKVKQDWMRRDRYIQERKAKEEHQRKAGEENSR